MTFGVDEEAIRRVVHQEIERRSMVATLAVPEAAAAIGIQLSGNSRIGTFVQGIDAATATKISETIADLSKAVERIQTGTDPHQRAVDEHPMFQAALHEAKHMCEDGHVEDASRAFMDALEQEDRDECKRQEDRRRLRLRLLEEGLVYDQRALKVEAALAKLRLIAEVTHPGDQKAQARFLIDRASQYEGLGTVKGDKSALLIAVSVFRWVAKEATNVER